MAVRPYAAAVNNRFEIACVACLLFEYFASVLSGVGLSATLDAAVVITKLSLVVFAAQRTARPYLVKWCARTASEADSAPASTVALDALNVPLLSEGAGPRPSMSVPASAPRNRDEAVV
jgi:hypothetical protein